MITRKQRISFNSERMPAVLIRDFRPAWAPLVLSKGTLVEIVLYTLRPGVLYVSGEIVDLRFPYDAAELLE